MSLHNLRERPGTMPSLRAAMHSLVTRSDNPNRIGFNVTTCYALIVLAVNDTTINRFSCNINVPFRNSLVQRSVSPRSTVGKHQQPVRHLLRPSGMCLRFLYASKQGQLIPARFFTSSIFRTLSPPTKVGWRAMAIRGRALSPLAGLHRHSRLRTQYWLAYCSQVDGASK